MFHYKHSLPCWKFKAVQLACWFNWPRSPLQSTFTVWNGEPLEVSCWHASGTKVQQIVLKVFSEVLRGQLELLCVNQTAAIFSSEGHICQAGLSESTLSYFYLIFLLFLAVLVVLKTCKELDKTGRGVSRMAVHPAFSTYLLVYTLQCIFPKKIFQTPAAPI